MQVRPVLKKVYNRLPLGTRLLLVKSFHAQTSPQLALNRLVNGSISLVRNGRAVTFTGPLFHPKRVFPADHFDCWEEDRIALEGIRRALDSVGVAYALLPGRYGAKTVVIAETDKSRAMRALAATLPSSEAWHLRPRRQSLKAAVDLARVKPSGSLPRKIATSSEFRLFRIHQAPDGTVINSQDGGGQLSFWKPVTDPTIDRADGGYYPVGTLMAPSHNGIAAYLSPESWQDAVNSPEKWPAYASNPHIYQVTEPIDLVYTWVDGDDPQWRRRKDEALGITDVSELNDTAAGDSRFASRDELLYSLRSIEMYANWIRNIYIVTDRQVPSWLDTDNPRVKVVDHAEIFTDPSLLPVFNSHAIESQIHHIEGLGDSFLYMNDDAMFGRRVQPGDFFQANGLSKYFPSRASLDIAPASSRDLPVLSAAKQARDLMAQRFGVTITNKFKHTPMAIRRHVMAEMEENLDGLFQAVAASKFRHPHDYSIPSAFYHYYAYATARAVPGNILYGYQDISSPDLSLFLTRLLAEHPYRVFCLNDTDTTPEQLPELDKKIRAAMDQYYPFKSSFEK